MNYKKRKFEELSDPSLSLNFTQGEIPTTTNIIYDSAKVDIIFSYFMLIIN